jgi:hypothetical protein
LFGGGPLSSVAGDKLVAAGVPIVSLYGGTEFGGPIEVFDEKLGSVAPIRPSTDWAWLKFSKRTAYKMEPEGDGTYNLVIFVSGRLILTTRIYVILTIDKEKDDYELPFYNVAGEKAYATGDLFEPHPTKNGLWRM